MRELCASTFSVLPPVQVVLFDFGSRGLGGRCGHREDPVAGSRFDHGVQFLSVGPNDAQHWKETWLFSGNDMGIVWEAYHKGVPLLGVPGITLDL